MEAGRRGQEGHAQYDAAYCTGPLHQVSHVDILLYTLLYFGIGPCLTKNDIINQSINYRSDQPGSVISDMGHGIAKPKSQKG